MSNSLQPPSSLPPPVDFAGTIVAGKYKVESLVGRGAMGSVWSARHMSLGRAVAIKFIHPQLTNSREALRRFQTEAKAAAKLKSRHVAQVYDDGVTESGQPYIVMEFLEGKSLEAAIRERGPLAPDEVIDIIREAAQALEVAHAAGVVHRDLKPDNIMLSRDPEAKRRGYTVKLVDFGIAKLLTDEAAVSGTTHAGSVLGTPHYMAPEALTSSSPVDTRSDVWSLGACAFAAMVGKVPFDGDVIGDIVLKVCAAPMPVPSTMRPEVPAGFDVWFAKACQRDPARRFATMKAMSDALGDLDRLEAQGSPDLQYGIRPVLPSVHDRVSIPMPPSSSRTRMLAGVVLGASLAVGALGLFVWKRTDEANRAITDAAASAAASVNLENERRLEAADRAFWAAQSQQIEAGPPAAASAATSKPRREKHP
jgi:serine/threonine-protein kinase